MPLWIKGPEQNSIEELGVRFRFSDIHGPFDSVRDAAIYWRGVAGAEPGEEITPFWDEPLLIEIDLPETEEELI